MKHSYGAVDVVDVEATFSQRSINDQTPSQRKILPIVLFALSVIVLGLLVSRNQFQSISTLSVTLFQLQQGRGPQVRPNNIQITSIVYPTKEPTILSPTEFPTYSPTVTGPTGRLFSTYREGYPLLEHFNPSIDSIFKYKFLSNFAGIVEPYATMHIVVFSEPDSDMALSAELYSYSICSTDDDGLNCTDYSGGSSFKLPCSAGDEFFVTITDSLMNATIGDGYLRCSYVRRELRSLTEQDLSATITAMWQMWDMEEDDGQSLYGSDFHNYAQLLEFHFFGAAWQDADHVHEGNGFLPQHLKMDMIFSKSLTAIDPSVSLFYWDFTIETATGVDVWDSPMFTNSTFGSLNLPADRDVGWTYNSDNVNAGAIPNSKWANFRADMNNKFEDLKFGYGYMRVPWNLNPSNVITRFTSIDKTLPTCESHLQLISYTSFSSFLHQVPYGAHASAHGAIGGVFGCDLFDSLLDAGYIIDEEAKLNLCKNWIFYMKELYRGAIIVPLKDCTAENESGDYSTEAQHQNCGFECVPDMINILYLQLKTSILNSDFEVIDVENMPDEGWDAWKDFICDGDGFKIFGGDHLESASPADPSFWPIHPTLERLLHAKYMANGFDTDQFPSDTTSEYVCNKQTCYDSRYSVTKDVRSSISSWPSCCFGHYGEDRMIDAISGDRDAGIGPTNYEIMSWNNPMQDSYRMDYIYDSFRWDHCSAIGYDIRAQLELQHSGQAEPVVEKISSGKGW